MRVHLFMDFFISNTAIVRDLWLVESSVAEPQIQTANDVICRFFNCTGGWGMAVLLTPEVFRGRQLYLPLEIIITLCIAV